MPKRKMTTIEKKSVLNDDRVDFVGEDQEEEPEFEVAPRRTLRPRKPTKKSRQSDDDDSDEMPSDEEEISEPPSSDEEEFGHRRKKKANGQAKRNGAGGGGKRKPAVAKAAPKSKKAPVKPVSESDSDHDHDDDDDDDDDDDHKEEEDEEKEENSEKGGSDNEDEAADADSLKEKARICQKCDKVFKNPAEASSCLNKHNMVRCYFCFKIFKDTEKLFEHYAKGHKKGSRKDNVTCPQCNQSVPFKSVSCHMISLHLM